MKIVILYVILMFLAFVFGAIWMKRKMARLIKSEKNKSDKHLRLFFVMCTWMTAVQRGKKIKNYFVENSYKNVAIYGMSYIGQLLQRELEKENINVIYGIDTCAGDIEVDLEMYSPDDVLPQADVIIVTPVFFYNEIKNKLEKRVKCSIISFDEVLSDVMSW